MILAIDTSGMNLGLAICSRGNIINSLLLNTGLRHGEILQHTVDNFLRDSNCELKDIKGISVTLGPGSFTGLRIGLAAAKGYAYALNVPLSGISTLFASAHYFTGVNKEVVVIIDARKSEYYYARFDCSGSEPVRLCEDTAGDINELTKSTGDKTILFGPAHLKEHFVALTSQTGYHISDNYNLAVPAAIRGERKIDSGERLDISSSTPVYIRAGF